LATGTPGGGFSYCAAGTPGGGFSSPGCYIDTPALPLTPGISFESGFYNFTSADNLEEPPNSGVSDLPAGLLTFEVISAGGGVTELPLGTFRPNFLTFLLDSSLLELESEASPITGFLRCISTLGAAASTFGGVTPGGFLSFDIYSFFFAICSFFTSTPLFKDPTIPPIAPDDELSEYFFNKLKTSLTITYVKSPSLAESAIYLPAKNGISSFTNLSPNPIC